MVLAVVLVAMLVVGMVVLLPLVMLLILWPKFATILSFVMGIDMPKMKSSGAELPWNFSFSIVLSEYLWAIIFHKNDFY